MIFLNSSEGAEITADKELSFTLDTKYIKKEEDKKVDVSENI